MIVFQNPQPLIRTLGAIPAHTMIAIDGWFHAGKSHLAIEVAEAMGRWWLDLDSFLERQKTSYVKSIYVEELRAALSDGSPHVVSGVCMREVLHRVGFPSSVHVYVKRMSRGDWVDEGDASGTFRDLPDYPRAASTLEAREYHSNWAPHARASYVLEREA